MPDPPVPNAAAIDAVVTEIRRLPEVDGPVWDRVTRRHPRADGRVFSKVDLIRGYRRLCRERGMDPDPAVVAKVRRKPTRTASGVAPVTVLTRPHPCPGRCVFCPSDVRMPKSYLSREPGAQRAAAQEFDPYGQTALRLAVLADMGHVVDKVELLVLGGTWCSYPAGYRRWFVARCLEALNEGPGPRPGPAEVPGPSWARLPVFVRPGDPGAYNRLVARALRRDPPGEESAGWERVRRAQVENETAPSRCVGLVVETRPDAVTPERVEELRRLGVTKVQLGIQSLSDRILALNRRGHPVAATRRAMELLRGAGFKLLVHWMPNLLGATLDSDREDFRRLFDDPAIRPDELKIYPCSLLENAELHRHWEAGEWRPYDEVDLVGLLADCLAEVPPWCRVTRVFRDIPGDEIVAGTRTTNLREVIEEAVAARGAALREIRSREVRARDVRPEELRAEEIEYDTGTGREVFLQLVDSGSRLGAFARLSLPGGDTGPRELAGSALLREVHVYGRVRGFGPKGGEGVQHRGLGSGLVARAVGRSREAGFRDLAVISSVGTRGYYRGLGFVDGELYQHLELDRSEVPGARPDGA